MSSFLEQRFSEEEEQPKKRKHVKPIHQNNGLKDKKHDDNEPDDGKFKNSELEDDEPEEAELDDEFDVFDDDPDNGIEFDQPEQDEQEQSDEQDSLLNARMRSQNSDDDEDFEKFDRDENSNLSEEDIKDLEGLEDLMSEETHIKDERRRLKLQRISQSIVTVICVYLIILIFGAVITEYHYGDNGAVEPVIMAVSQIEDKEEFGALASLYLQARSLYEDILVLDYRVAQNNSDLMSIAPEYEEALDTVSILATSIEGADLLSKYNQVSSMLLEWVQTHLAAYCQYMSIAISQNDDDAATEAIAARSYVYTDFQLITENIITMGEEIQVYDLTDIKSWSPEEYVEQATGGIVD